MDKLNSRTKVKCPVSYRTDLKTKFHENIKNGKRNSLSLYPENFENAERLCKVIQDNWATTKPLHVIVYKQLQGGKTSDIRTFIETCCEDIERDEMLFLSGDPQKAAFNQNSNRLNHLVETHSLVRLSNSLKTNSPLIDLSKIKILFLDEHQMGIGEDSLTKNFLETLYDLNENLIVVAITATTGGFSDFNISWVKFQEGEGYYGIGKFLENNQVHDLTECLDGGTYSGNDNFFFYDKIGEDGSTQVHLKDHLKQNIDQLSEMDIAGIGFIRHNNPLEAANLIENYIKGKGYNIRVITAHSNEEKTNNGKTIAQAQEELEHNVMTEEISSIIIFTGIYRAGNDLDKNTPAKLAKHLRMKERTCFGYEDSDPNYNTHLQSIPGRFCGYHNNTRVKIYANKRVLEIYRDFYEGKITVAELDSVIHHSDFNRLKTQRRVNPSTHLKIKGTVRADKKISPMIALPLKGDLAKCLQDHKHAIEAEGFEIEPLTKILKGYMKENQHKFFSDDPENRVRIRRKSYNRFEWNGKLYYANGKALSNYKDKSDSRREINQMAITGYINKERFRTRNNKEINIGLYADDTPGQDLVIWLCLEAKNDLPFNLIPSSYMEHSSLYNTDSMIERLGYDGYERIELDNILN